VPAPGPPLEGQDGQLPRRPSNWISPWPGDKGGVHEQRLRLFSRNRILLSDILPLLAHLGVEVTDERTHVIVDG
jgi:Glutamate dehydrogenase, ACT3 domain